MPKIMHASSYRYMHAHACKHLGPVGHAAKAKEANTEIEAENEQTNLLELKEAPPALL